ncbi:MAG: primosomal protein N' [Treponemataceae bacterium]|nr:primosomal protein N' [Treponemataceae bacterium]
MRYVETVVNVPIDGSFTYISDDDAVQVGLRAEVTFGRRKMVACIVSVSETVPADLGCPVDKIKKIHRIIDTEPLFTTDQVQLARWMAHYYLCSWGEALFAMLPSGRRESDTGSFGFEEDDSSFTRHTLSEEQQQAIEGILQGGKSLYHYLYGPTGTGKTEVFLGAAEQVLAAEKGVIYLVPEIGLTHQVIEAVTKRFGNTVAVIHSSLTPSQRLKEWHRILNRQARVVIGARSAVFAPVPDLGLIIIDEEHDNSYKAGNTPRYHARQVAMKRCMDLKIPLVMGSATPSLEAWDQMQKGTISRHVLTRRLAGGKPPEIQAINLSERGNTPVNGCLSPALEDEIRATIAEKRQVILFLNRRGYAHFFKCNSCGYGLTCKNCSVSLTWHKAKNRFICHYCGYSVPVPTECPECGSLDVGLGSFGTEYIEQEVAAKFPNATVDRLDTDTMKDKKELESKLAAFRNGETDILLGTQMVAKGLNFPKLKLVGVVLADTGLMLPDFRAAERTFSLIVQVAGRAGRFFPDGKVLVQSYNPTRPAISYAVQNDITGFYDEELKTRQDMAFPPYARLMRLVFRSAQPQYADAAADTAAEILERIVQRWQKEVPDLPPVEILGPTECPLAMIAANHRRQILLRSDNIRILQDIMHAFVGMNPKLEHCYLEIDADPVNLL